MASYPELIELLGQGASASDPDRVKLATRRLLDTWGEVRERVGTDRFDRTLGSVRAGRLERRSSAAWTQTNGEHSEGDFVNLTLEVDSEELSLNVVGWFDPQLEKVGSWLRTPSARTFLRTLDENWQLVIFIRTGHVGARGKAVFRGAPGREHERIPIAGASPANLAIHVSALSPKLDPSREKLSLHIRRRWGRMELAESANLVGALSDEVERWLLPLEEIRLS